MTLSYLPSLVSPCAHCCYSVVTAFHVAPTTSAASRCSVFHEGTSETAVGVPVSSTPCWPPNLLSFLMSCSFVWCLRRWTVHLWAADVSSVLFLSKLVWECCLFKRGQSCLCFPWFSYEYVFVTVNSGHAFQENVQVSLPSNSLILFLPGTEHK